MPTFDVNQPLVPAVPVTTGMTTGLLSSRFTVTDLVAESPAAFVDEQVKVTPAVFDETVVASHPGFVATPDSLSATVQLTCASLVYQLSVPTVPATAGVITGALASRLTMTDSVVESPAPFVAVQVYVVPAAVVFAASVVAS